MADFTPDIAGDVLAAIRGGSEEVAGAFGRALDGEFVVAVAHAETIVSDSLPQEWQGPGLVVAFAVGDVGALLLLPTTSGLLPDWCADPDTIGERKLATLAQELGILVLPEAFAAGPSKAAYVGNLAECFQDCEPAQSAASLPITLTSGEQLGTAHLVLPVQKPMTSTSEAAAAGQTNASTEASEPSPGIEPQSTLEQTVPGSAPPPTRKRIQYADLDDGIRQLPSYAKSLLKVEVPVTVTLSSTQQTVEQILQLGPGSILKFDKPCEENLELEIGGQTIAEGEAVKVGDKFGLWITAMTIPAERFWVVNGKRSGTRVQ